MHKTPTQNYQGNRMEGFYRKLAGFTVVIQNCPSDYVFAPAFDSSQIGDFLLF